MGIHRGKGAANDGLGVDLIVKADARTPVLLVVVDRRVATATDPYAASGSRELQNTAIASDGVRAVRIEE